MLSVMFLFVLVMMPVAGLFLLFVVPLMGVFLFIVMVVMSVFLLLVVPVMFIFMRIVVMLVVMLVMSIAGTVCCDSRHVNFRLLKHALSPLKPEQFGASAQRGLRLGHSLGLCIADCSVLKTHDACRGRAELYLQLPAFQRDSHLGCAVHVRAMPAGRSQRERGKTYNGQACDYPYKKRRLYDFHGSMAPMPLPETRIPKQHRYAFTWGEGRK